MPAIEKYRPDIDGLRAVAIVAVLLYHAGLDVLPGGFVGVDVFFVISGYLITQIIVGEIERGTFSIAGFYERRVRRIFPALVTIVLATGVFACWILLPVDVIAFGRSVVTVTLFISNALFWWTSGYFEVGASEKPLLHTWSLAVEEQFYIVFPIYLLAVRRFGGARYRTYTWPIVLGSLGLSAWAVTTYPSAAFYLIPTRAWELGIGALLAMGAFPSCRAAWQRELLSGVGACLILYSAGTFSARTPFPGLNALYPCAGAAMIIHAGAEARSAVGRVLGTKPVVFIGLISYSLYLWHWPALSLAKAHGNGTLTPLQLGALYACVVAVSVASWRFVERPFRSRAWRWSRRQTLSGAALAMAGTGALGGALLVAHGLPGRFGPEMAPFIAESADRSLMEDPCNDLSPAAVHDGKLCRIGAPGGVPPTVFVWGDSLADAAAPVIAEVAAEHGAAGFRATRLSCPPLLGVQREGADGVRCVAFNEEVFGQLRSHPEIRDVVLVGRWAKNAEGVPYKHDPDDDPAFLTDALSRNEAIENDEPVFSRGLERTLGELEGLHKRTWILTSVPEVGVAVPYVLARAIQHHQSVDVAPTRAEYLERQAFVFRTFDRLHETHAFRVLHAEDVFCHESACDVVRSGRPLYHDATHPSRFGAELLSPLFEPIFTSNDT